MTNDVIIVGDECVRCKYCTLVNEDDPKNIGVCCSARDGKYFHWGQSIPCEWKETK